MTELTITPKVSDKTARFKGTIAAGEHIAVTIKGGAEWIGEDDGANLTLRVIDLTTKRTLAVFPRPAETLEENEEPDAWGSSGDDLTCTLNLNTLRMVNAARHLIRVPVLFVLGDTDAPRTLYFKDIYEVEYWPERIGDDVPYDLDKWPKKIDEWTELVDEWTEQMAAFGETLSGHVGNVSIHVTADQKSAWTSKQDAISDLDAIRAGAEKGATAIQAHQDISGKADLVGGKVPQSQLPSYVDDVLEYASLSAFPQTGEEGKIYVAKDTNLTYRWSGTQYVQVGGGGTSGQAQSDWNQTDATAPDFIKNKPTIPSKTSELTNDSGFLTQHQDISGKLDKTDVVTPSLFANGKAADAGKVYLALNLLDTEKAAKSEMSVTTGTGADADKATIQLKTGASVTVLTQHQSWSDVKPSGGIPKTDLASAVQTSLDKADTAVQPSGIAELMPMYMFLGVLPVNAVVSLQPFAVNGYAATSTADAFEVAVGGLPAGVSGKARDCILVIDCTATGAVAPTVTWGTHFHPRTDIETDLAIVEAGKRAVFYISEYAAGEFAVGGWVETEGGNT